MRTTPIWAAVSTSSFGDCQRKWRLPLRAYHCGMFFRRRCPWDISNACSVPERMEVGFNLYYTFREGETAWLYARLLKLFRERMGVTVFQSSLPTWP